MNSAINNVKSTQNAWDKTTDNWDKVNQDIIGTNQAVSQVLSTQDINVIKVDETKTVETKAPEVQQDKLANSHIEKTETTVISLDSKDDIQKVNDESSEIMSDNEALAKDIINHTHFKAIKYNPLDTEDLLSEEIVSLQQKIGEAKYNNNDELAHFLTLRVNNLKEQRIALTEARLNQEVQAEIATNSYQYQSKNITPEKANELTAFATNVSEDWTPGQKLAHYSDGLIELNIAIEGFMKNNNPDTYTMAERKNYYDILSHLLQVYVRTERKAVSIEKEAARNLGDPAYTLELPEVDIKNAVKINTIPTTPDVQKVEKVKSSNKTIFKESPVQVYGTSKENIEQQTIKSTENVKVQENSQVVQENKEASRVEKSNTTIDESKLADVSVGQMGIFEEEEDEKTERKPGEIDLEKLFDVSSGQMGIWDEIEDILDEDIAKNSLDKSKDDDDDYER